MDIGVQESGEQQHLMNGHHLHPAASTQVFINQDLIHMILHMLRDEESPTPTGAVWKKRFVPLLFVNRSFFTMGVEIIWKDMPSLLPLMKLLPSFKAEATGYTLDGIQNSDWTRFDMYAKHVKLFVFQDSCPLENLHDQWITFLSIKAAKSPLFPNLRHIGTNHKSRGAIRLLPIALLPPLRTLQVLTRIVNKGNDPESDWEGEDDDDTVAESSSSMISTVLLVAPRLSQLTYLGPIHEGFLLSIGNLKDLTELHLTFTTIHCFTCISPLNQLLALRSLKLVALFDWAFDQARLAPPVQRPPPSFPSLRVLQLLTTSRNFVGFIEQLGPTQLEVLETTVTDLETVHLNGLVAAVKSNPGLQGLISSNTDLEWGDAFDNWNAGGQTMLLFALMEGIKSGSLSDIVLTGLPFFTQFEFQLARNQILQDIPSSRLRTFKFSNEGHIRTEADEPYLATLDILQRLAFEGCKTLKHLELNFKTGAFSTPPSAPCQQSKHGLQTLTIFTDEEELDLSIHDKISIAEFLHVLFPSLQIVTGTAETEWEEINALVRSYHKVRETTLATVANV